MDWFLASQTPPRVSRRQWSQIKTCIVLIEHLDSWLCPHASLEVSQALLELRLFFKQYCHYYWNELALHNYDLTTAIIQCRAVLYPFEPFNLSARRALYHLGQVQANFKQIHTLSKSPTSSSVTISSDVDRNVSMPGFPQFVRTPETTTILKESGDQRRSSDDGETVGANGLTTRSSINSTDSTNKEAAPAVATTTRNYSLLSLSGISWSIRFMAIKVIHTVAMNLAYLFSPIFSIISLGAFYTFIVFQWLEQCMAWSVLICQAMAALGIVVGSVMISVFIFSVRVFLESTATTVWRAICHPFESIMWVCLCGLLGLSMVLMPVIISTSIFCSFIASKRFVATV